ncbi:unnamed protein product [Sphenostylis stenocarpa]|uniref:non-specific serine/threonine protein kinase n=1 Tax=Sphenostylis stenocarpa TaxID=92480 RepID=A0AA86RV93_9FABA|nr:unnamed protein product [Sphenostylis stenocarpa]
MFDITCNWNESTFLEMRGVEFYGGFSIPIPIKRAFASSVIPKHNCSMDDLNFKELISKHMQVVLTSQKSNTDQQGYHLTATGFRKFSYSELKKATKGFSQEIGSGAGGVVYKGILSDQRYAAIKRLDEAKQGEGEFLAEVSIIGRLNHMNLIEMWGYCAEGKHRLLVYEYMENGSLAENLSTNTLDWSKRYNIAIGTARVLAYVHEECLEWILHCDIKPQNILLDSNYEPKLADFGLSKLLKRDNPNNPSISMIRGTRGYMAPEWVFNLPITSKVDVYSYGIVVLEMVTGKSTATSVQDIDGEEAYDGRLVAWVREKRSNANSSWVEQIIEPAIGPDYDKSKMEVLTTVALNCVMAQPDEIRVKRTIPCKLALNTALSITIFLLASLLSSQPSSSSSSLRMGSCLSAENPEDILISPNAIFSAGFLAIGYSFAIWFTEPHFHSPSTVTWMANRDQPVNGKRSKLSLTLDANLVLVDAAFNTAWSSNTVSSAPVELHLKDDGNLVLREVQGTVLWQSYDFPTDTLVPAQPLTRYTILVSSRSESNHSSGFYKFFFDDNNVLGLHYDGPDVSSSYWPQPWLLSWDVGRTSFNSSRIGVLNSLGLFNSTDNFTFVTSDYGTVLQRRLKVDCDGNVRVYSRNNVLGKWYVSWQAISSGCIPHGICGPNSLCVYDRVSGRKCLCLPGHRLKNHSDWSQGCEPLFHLTCHKNESMFLEIPSVEFYGYDNHYVEVSNYSACEKLCLQDCTCKGFQHSYSDDKRFYRCYTKTQLLNGRRSPVFQGSTYLRLPKSNSFSHEEYASEPLYDHVCYVQLQRAYIKTHGNRLVKIFLWFATALGAFEMICVLVIWCLLIRTRQKSKVGQEGYHHTESGFRKFSYSELKKATKGFSQEIGRGAGGVVYKGILSDQRHAAIKRLYNAKQGEGEFLAEVGIIGRLNHMNLIEMWGYCAEGKHRLLVCEYMENGSLAENLSSNTLDWSKRYNIALGTARVLAYLHEQCLEWILHCDIKPQNILLDSNYEPKLADFGLSKLMKRDNPNNPSISMIRGTRGYMAPEWVLNLPITSKVDVYSYGIVVLEMITGKSTTRSIHKINDEETYDGRLVEWVREKSGSNTKSSWLEQIIDPDIGPAYDKIKMEILSSVALNCAMEDRDSRPTMSQVVEMLQ